MEGIAQNTNHPHYNSMSNVNEGSSDIPSVEIITNRNSSQQQQSNCSNINDEINESVDIDRLLVFGAKQIISLFVPVSLCMIFVSIVARSVKYYASTTQYLIYTPFHTEGASTGTVIWQTVANMAIMIAVIAVVTFFLVLLFKYRCYEFIQGWLFLTTIMILFLLNILFVMQVVVSLDIFADYISILFIIWNIGMVGIVVIHWKGPLLAQQSYLIFIAGQISLMLLKFIPPWTTWLLLFGLAIWDLVAVLCPYGPLRMLVEMAVERDQPLMPALIYSTAVSMTTFGGVTKKGYSTTVPAGDGEDVEAIVATSSTNNNNDIQPGTSENNGTSNIPIHGHPNPSPPGVDHPVSGKGQKLGRRMKKRKAEPKNKETATVSAARNLRDIQDDVLDRDERGVKLGLGDFVFYSLLIGRASLDGDNATVLTCYVAILVGMCLTILLLGIAGRALPALPISIVCGIIFYFLTNIVISPFVNELAIQSVIL